MKTHHSTSPTRWLAILGIAGIALTQTANAQVSYGILGSTYTEDFNSGLESAAVTLTWTDNSVFTGVYAYQFGGSDPILDEPAGPVAQYRKTSGNSSGIELFQWRSSSTATDGAFGTKPADATGSIAIGLRLNNSTGVTLTQFTLGYTGEQWVSSDSDQNNQLVVSYQLGSPATLADGTWTEIPSLQFDSPFDNADTNLNGNLPANRQVFSPTTISGISWADGTDLYLRWFDANSALVDQGLAIDDITFTAVPEPSTWALFIGGAVALIVLRRRQARA